MSLKRTCHQYTHRDFSYSTLTDPRVGSYISFFIWFELLDRVYSTIVVQALCLVHTSICSRGDESKNVVLGKNGAMACIPFGTIQAHWVML